MRGSNVGEQRIEQANYSSLIAGLEQARAVRFASGTAVSAYS